MTSLIDLSQIVENDMPVYPGDLGTNLFQYKYLIIDSHNNHRLDISMHTGTHIDGPMHLTENNTYISDFPLESFIGAGCIIDVRDQSVIKYKPEYEELIKCNSIVLLYTGWDVFYGEEKYYKEHPVVHTDFCELLIRKNVKAFGMDMPSPDQYPFPAHKLLLSNDIYIIENLTNLDKLVHIDELEVIALPLKIKADSSMVRVAARIIL